MKREQFCDSEPLNFAFRQKGYGTLANICSNKGINIQQKRTNNKQKIQKKTNKTIVEQLIVNKQYAAFIQSNRRWAGITKSGCIVSDDKSTVRISVVLF